MFEKAIKEIEKYDRIIIHRHKNPDGDAIGAQIGLLYIIKDNFPSKEVYAVGDESKKFGFLCENDFDSIPDSSYSDALAIILDTSAHSLISDERYNLAATRLRIDHHIFCEKIAETEVVDTTSESCCGLICHMARECGLSVGKIAARALYTGMVTDSGRFRYDSTNARTMENAAFLMNIGIDTSDIYSRLYADSYESLKLRATYILKINFSEHNVAYIYTTADELSATGASAFSISRGMVGTMADIKGVDIWVNFTECDGTVLCEIRSSKYNINPVAVEYGGGGHAKASGATLDCRETAMNLLADLDNMAASGDGNE